MIILIYHKFNKGCCPQNVTGLEEGSLFKFDGGGADIFNLGEVGKNIF